jgi:hypothetical protein
MTDVAIASTSRTNAEAGADLARQIREGLKGTPDALIVFASPDNDYELLLSELESAVSPGAPIVGCSSAGEFTGDTSGTGLSTAIALKAGDMSFRASIATGISKDRKVAARELVKDFAGIESAEYRYRTALLLLDALAGHAEDLVDQLTTVTGGMYQFVGGGAGDDARFQKTHVFLGRKAHSDAAVALEILSNKPIGIGARHGWQPASDALRVTEAADACMLSLNVSPAVEIFEEHAKATNQVLDRDAPMPFFLHNIVGVKTEDGHKLRVPLGISEQGGITCAAEVPAGSVAQIMSTGAQSASEAAANAARDAVEQVTRSGNKPKAALFFDCVATRLRLGKEFGQELAAVSEALDNAPFAGFNSYGQVVRAEGQFSGFHNCTAVVCVIPD